MDPSNLLMGVIGVLITIMAVGVPLFVKALRDIKKEVKEQLKTVSDGLDNTHSQCDKIKDRQIINETKLDMLLDEKGFDIRKVNKAIKEHMDELQENNTPSIGCINIKELYRTTQEN